MGAAFRQACARVGLALRQRFLGHLVVRRHPPAVGPTAERGREHAIYLAAATALLPLALRREVRQVLDVGCRNWSYAAAVAHAFPRAEMVGIEVDGHRRFVDLHRRIDHARAYAGALGGRGKVVHGDFRHVALPAPPRDGILVIAFFFPFLAPASAHAWGMPSAFADFGALVARARAHAPGRRRIILSVHQGLWEAQAAEAIYAAAATAVRRLHLTPSRCPVVADSPYDPWIMTTGLQ